MTGCLSFFIATALGECFKSHFSLTLILTRPGCKEVYVGPLVHCIYIQKLILASAKAGPFWEFFNSDSVYFRARIARDGNCLFRAFAQAIMDDQGQQQNIRKNAVKAIVQNWAMFQDSIEKVRDIEVKNVLCQRNHLGFQRNHLGFLRASNQSSRAVEMKLFMTMSSGHQGLHLLSL